MTCIGYSEKYDHLIFDVEILVKDSTEIPISFGQDSMKAKPNDKTILSIFEWPHSKLPISLIDFTSYLITRTTSFEVISETLYSHKFG